MSRPRKALVLDEETVTVIGPTLGRIVHVNLGVVDPLWRAAFVVDVHRFGVRTDDWSAIAEILLPPGDRGYPPGSKVWKDDSGRHFVHLKPDTHGDALGCWRWPPRE